jgi:hypothetical protein
MDEVIEKTEFTYDELDDDAKAKARAWYIEGQSADFDADFTKDDAVTCLKYLGFSVGTYEVTLMNGKKKQKPSIMWEDNGTTFTGWWDANDLDLAGLLAHAPQDEELRKFGARAMAIFMRWPLSTAYVKNSGYTMELQWAQETPDSDSNEDGDTEIFQLLEQLAKDIADWIHQRIEDEYDYQTSDEAAVEGIECNEYKFDENGEVV